MQFVSIFLTTFFETFQDWTLIISYRVVTGTLILNNTQLFEDVWQKSVSIFACIYSFYFFFLRLNSWNVSVDRKWWWVKHFTSWLKVWSPAEGGKSIFWSMIYPLRRWDNYSWDNDEMPRTFIRIYKRRKTWGKN